MHKHIIDSYSAYRIIETAKCLWVQQPKPGRVCNQDPLQPQWVLNMLQTKKSSMPSTYFSMENK